MTLLPLHLVVNWPVFTIFISNVVLLVISEHIFPRSNKCWPFAVAENFVWRR